MLFSNFVLFKVCAVRDRKYTPGKVAVVLLKIPRNIMMIFESKDGSK